MATLNFNASAIDTASHDPIPAGTYEAVITATEIKPTRSANGTGINITFEILSGGAKGRKVWEWINYQHPNQEAQRIGQQTLATICKVLGIAQLNETEQLHNVPLMITVGLDRNDATRNVIRGYAAKSSSQAAPSAAPAASPAACAAGTGAAPWAR